MIMEGARIVNYDLVGTEAKLITNFKSQVNLAVHTYDVTLLKDLTKFDHFNAYILKIPSRDDLRIKVLKIDLDAACMYLLLLSDNSKVLFAVELERFEEFMGYIKSFGN